jgi:hypothetical protein
MFLQCDRSGAGRETGDSSVEKNGAALNYSTGWGEPELVDGDATLARWKNHDEMSFLTDSSGQWRCVCI